MQSENFNILKMSNAKKKTLEKRKLKSSKKVHWKLPKRAAAAATSIA